MSAWLQITSRLTIGNTVGGFLWCNVHSNKWKISISATHSDWVGGRPQPLFAKATDDSTLMAPSTRRKAKLELSLMKGTWQPSLACSGQSSDLSVTNHVCRVMGALWCIIQVVFWLQLTVTVRPESWAVWDEVLTKSSLTPRCGVSSPHTASRGRRLRHRLSQQHFPAWACCYFRQ